MTTIPQTAGQRLRWTATDAWVLTLRTLMHWKRQPGLIIGGLVFPIISVVLFGYVFGSAMAVPGGGDYREFLLPGMFGQTMVFGVATTMTAVLTDVSKGVTNRFRAMPMSRSGVVVGRSLADILNSTLDLIVLMVCGMVVGWQWRDGFGNVLVAVVLLLWLRFAVIWAGIYIGLILPNPESAGLVWGLLFPVTMLASTFVSPALMPGWLGAIADWNPLSATVNASRHLFGNPGLAGSSWAAQHSVLLAVLWPMVLTAIFMPLSVRRYRRISG